MGGLTLKFKEVQERPETGTCLLEGSTAKKEGKMKQIVLLTLTEMVVRELKVDLARQVEEEMAWKVQLENEDDCQNMIQITEAFERTTRKEKAKRLKFGFQLSSGMETVQLADYKAGGQRRP